MASGMPSSRRQICTIAGALRSLRVKPGSASAARVVKRRIASYSGSCAAGGRCPRSGSRSDGTRYVNSPSIPNVCRLVASIRTVALARNR
jgi:hypothetical protein